jgi:hypothetical protein
VGTVTTRASDPDDRARLVRGLIADEPGPRDGPVALLRRVCRAATRELAASGVGVTVMADGGVRGMSAASDPASEQIEELQFLLGEGPCVDAFAERRPVLTAELTSQVMARWPAYGPAAYDAGVRAVFAFPLQIGAARLGVLDVFRRQAGSLTGEQLSTAFVFADLTVEALLDHQEGAVDRADGGDLGTDVLHRPRLFQAQGMVMVQLGISIGEALVRLRAHAYAENLRLDDVARDVVNRTLRFDRDKE